MVPTPRPCHRPSPLASQRRGRPHTQSLPSPTEGWGVKAIHMYLIKALHFLFYGTHIEQRKIHQPHLAPI